MLLAKLDVAEGDPERIRDMEEDGYVVRVVDCDTSGNSQHIQDGHLWRLLVCTQLAQGLGRLEVVVLVIGAVKGQRADQ